MTNHSAVSPGDKPFWVKCQSCGHCWAVAYLPMDLALFAKIGREVKRCIRCGAPKPIVAKQHDGVLKEPAA